MLSDVSQKVKLKMNTFSILQRKTSFALKKTCTYESLKKVIIYVILSLMYSLFSKQEYENKKVVKSALQVHPRIVKRFV